LPCQGKPREPPELLSRPYPHPRFDALGHLSHHGQAHRDVEPVDQVLGSGVEVARQLAHILAAIGQEGDLLLGCIPCAFSTSKSRRFGPCLPKGPSMSLSVSRHGEPGPAGVSGRRYPEARFPRARPVSPCGLRREGTRCMCTIP
jgi:hypothetical protein